MHSSPPRRTAEPLAPAVRAERWGRVIVALQTSPLRAAFLREQLRMLAAHEAAEALELLCLRAEAGDDRGIAGLHALIELFADPDLREARDALRGEARKARLFTLERILRRPFVSDRSARKSEVPRRMMSLLETDGEDPIEREETRDMPDYGRGRPLTLGERKSIARRPPPELLPRVLADPHPDVIRNVLMSARLTEDDVVRLCTKRPNRAEVLHEVARHPRWCHRPRVRLALVLNPATPTELSISMVALLHRGELASVVLTNAIHPAVRTAAHERLERLPPVRRPPDGAVQ